MDLVLTVLAVRLRDRERSPHPHAANKTNAAAEAGRVESPVTQTALPRLQKGIEQPKVGRGVGSVDDVLGEVVQAFAADEEWSVHAFRPVHAKATTIAWRHDSHLRYQ
jgi:hypothetical protein